MYKISKQPEYRYKLLSNKVGGKKEHHVFLTHTCALIHAYTPILCSIAFNRLVHIGQYRHGRKKNTLHRQISPELTIHIVYDFINNIHFNRSIQWDKQIE